MKQNPAYLAGRLEGNALKLPKIKAPGFLKKLPFGKKKTGEDEGMKTGDEDDFLAPNTFQKRLPLIGLLSAYTVTFAVVGGIVYYLSANSADIQAKEIAKRPKLVIETLTLERGTLPAAPQPGAPSETDTGDGTEGEPLPDGPEFEDSFADGQDQEDIYANLLQPHPDPALLEQSTTGPIPRIGEDGRSPWQVYSRPFNNLEARPQVAIMIVDLGLHQENTEKAIKLPGAVSLAFAPYARKLTDWVDQSRDAGHEVFMTLPLEPNGFPRSDPGPFALLSSLTAEQNIQRLEWILSRTTGYVGLVNFMGGRILNDESLTRPFLQNLKVRGLMFIDTGESLVSVSRKIAGEIQTPYLQADVILDKRVDRTAIATALASLESEARSNGFAIGVARPYPVSLDRIRLWARTLNSKGIALMPVSAIASQRQTF